MAHAISAQKPFARPFRAWHSVARFFGRARSWLGRSTLPLFAAAILGLAGVWALAPYASEFPAVFAPQNFAEAFVREVVQNHGADCARPHGRRCNSRREARRDPPYAPLERAARKVLRHAGFDALMDIRAGALCLWLIY